MPTPALRAALKLDILVIGAGQAGLSSAYHLKKLGLQPGKDFLVLDEAPAPGGAWQYRWPSLTLSTVNRVHDLPGLAFADFAGGDETVQASVAVPHYFAAYEEEFDLQVLRPATVKVVCDRGERLRVESDRGLFSVRGIINATGTWENPYIPTTPGPTPSAARPSTPATSAPPRPLPASMCSSWAAAFRRSSCSTRSRR